MKNVLIVEDSPIQAHYIRQELEELNLSVVTASTSFEAYRALKEATPDLIILDFLLPDANGIELCQRFKQDRFLRDTPVIMFSSENKLHQMVQAYEAGADYYVVKDEEGNKVIRVLADTLLTGQRRNYKHYTKSA